VPSRVEQHIRQESFGLDALEVSVSDAVRAAELPDEGHGVVDMQEVGGPQEYGREDPGDVGFDGSWMSSVEDLKRYREGGNTYS
jgi:guanyl-specific ribonuclease Sa